MKLPARKTVQWRAGACRGPYRPENGPERGSPRQPGPDVSSAAGEKDTGAGRESERDSREEAGDKEGAEWGHAKRWEGPARAIYFCQDYAPRPRYATESLRDPALTPPTSRSSSFSRYPAATARLPDVSSTARPSDSVLSSGDWKQQVNLFGGRWESYHTVRR